MTRIEFETAKTLITEYGTASAKRIAERLAIGPERLLDWLNHPAHNLGLSENALPALKLLCQKGIRAKFPA